MSDSTVTEQLLAYLPPDRAEAVLGGAPLPDADTGAVLFSDISGFTPLTEAVIKRYGPRQGGEHFTDHLNAVYDALIQEATRFGGSIVGFAGDAMLVWFSGDDGATAVTAGRHMQRAMARFAEIALPGGETVSLAMKVAVAAGPVRRLAVGDPRIQSLDVLAGAVMERVAACEGVAARGEIVVDAAIARHLGPRLQVLERRALGAGLEGHGAAAVVAGLDPESPAQRPASAAVSG
jgi:adenylate cyclase